MEVGEGNIVRGPFVAVESRFGGVAGIVFNQPGQEVPVAQFFKTNPKFPTLYFKTTSGNVYRLDKYGELINGRESERRNSITSTILAEEELQRAKLTVGEYFTFGEGHATTDINEIVATSETIYSDFNMLKQGCEGRTTSVVKEFEDLVRKGDSLIDLSPRGRSTQRSVSR